MATPLRTGTHSLWRDIRWEMKSVVDLWKLPRLRADKNRLDALSHRPMLLESLCEKRGKDRIVADQVVSEISGLCDILADRPPALVVEIGTAKGGTLYLWSRLARAGALLVSIDKPGELGSVRRVNRSVYRTFGRERGIRVITMSVDSHSALAHRRLHDLLGSRKVDFLFIDGDHSEEGVRADFEGYLRYMAPDGLIALHDIAIPSSHPWIQVQRFWEELTARNYRTRAITAQTPDRRGIGVVFLGAQTPTSAREST